MNFYDVGDMTYPETLKSLNGTYHSLRNFALEEKFQIELFIKFSTKIFQGTLEFSSFQSFIMWIASSYVFESAISKLDD